jgi:hypothetical protein
METPQERVKGIVGYAPVTRNENLAVGRVMRRFRREEAEHEREPSRAEAEHDARVAFGLEQLGKLADHMTATAAVRRRRARAKSEPTSEGLKALDKAQKDRKAARRLRLNAITPPRDIPDELPVRGAARAARRRAERAREDDVL